MLSRLLFSAVLILFVATLPVLLAERLIAGTACDEGSRALPDVFETFSVISDFQLSGLY